MKHRHMALGLSAALLLTSCGTVTQAADLAAEIQPQTVTGRAPDDAFLAAQTGFALTLLQHTISADSGENLLISPYSVMQALAMTANGAAGNTLAEMEQSLGGVPMDALNEYLYKWRTGQPDLAGCKLKTANSIWFRDAAERLRVLPEFLQTDADYYNAAAYKSPFDDSTVEAINNWCSDNTDGMIPELIGEIDEKQVMYLINAVVFDAEWETTFSEDDVREHDFTACDGNVQTAQMMYSDNEYRYLQDDHAEGFLRDYKGGRYAFAALLPEEGLSLEAYIAGLTPETLRDTLTSPQHIETHIGIPEFSYDYDAELSDALKAMGMEQAFTEGADFSRMAELTGDDYLYIGGVLHKTHIEVDPRGTKAAAVTSVEMNFSEDCDFEPQYKTVILNRPFLYMIVDTETMLPVFAGVLNQIPQ